jgi:hypothetical protein
MTNTNDDSPAFLALLQRDDVMLRMPAANALIDKIATRYDIELPRALRSFWKQSDGLETSRFFHGHILGATEIDELLHQGDLMRGFVRAGFVPIFHDHESNYLMLIVKRPMSPRIAYVPHDDGSQLLYANLDSMAIAISDAMDSGKSADVFYGIPGDYRQNGLRTEDDHAAARVLLKTDGEDGEWNFASQLLDESNLVEWAQLLETNHFIRRDVTIRLKSMTSTAIRELLQRDQIEFEKFVATFIEAAREAGFAVAERRGTVLNVAGKWCELEGFFYRRNAPDAMRRIIDWLRDNRAGRNPHDRANHIFVD